jgi:S-adenosylmethionine:tRNA ribosyltransferase-isomerase
MLATEDYEYDLPKSLIAQEPLRRRSDARLMVVDRRSGSIEHAYVRDLGNFLLAGDVLVLNDTRVVPARLVGRRQATGGRWEGLFLSEGQAGLWRVLAKARGVLHAGDRIILLDRLARPAFELEMAARLDDGSWAVRPQVAGTALELLGRVGRIPLPHYIRHGEMVDADIERYQTVFASKSGSIAAPTAGLHFTEQLLHQLASQDVSIERITLHIGVATFRPIKSEQVEMHAMHDEWCCVPEDVAARIQQARDAGRRIVAVGTTTVRTLETASASGRLSAWNGSTGLFIHPPYTFRTVDALVTNFHLPRSTLLVLVRTFGGDQLIRRAYQEAVEQKYRFYSYGDAMLIV